MNGKICWRQQFLKNLKNDDVMNKFRHYGKNEMRNLNKLMCSKSLWNFTTILFLWEEIWIKVLMWFHMFSANYAIISLLSGVNCTGIMVDCDVYPFYFNFCIKKVVWQTYIHRERNCFQRNSEIDQGIDTMSP